MFNKRAWLFGAVLATLLITLTFGASAVRAASYSVTITSTQFIPSTLQVAVGDQITFLNSTTATQSAVSSDTGGFNTGDIGPSQSKTVTLNTAGTFSYSSAYNPALSGTVTVSGTSTAITDTSTTSSTVSETQPQPVSGVFEVMVALIAGGFGLLGFGWYSSRRTGVYDPVVNLPLVSSSAEVNRDATQDH